jgi:RNA polymerase sigma-70 factor, ECF subfamily
VTDIAHAILLLALTRPGDDDAALAPRIIRGDRDAFAEFFDRHHAGLYAFLRSHGSDDDQAREIVQHAFVRLWDARERLRADGYLRAYLYRIALNHASNERRRRGHIVYDLSDRAASDSLPDELAVEAEFRQALEVAVARLPERRRHVFTLCMIEQFTYAEAAAALNVSVKTVENHMTLALRDLRSALSAFRKGQKTD